MGQVATALFGLLLALPVLAAEPFRDCADCPSMVRIAPGQVLMGSPKNEAGRSDDGREGPQRPATVTRAFALGQFEITVREFSVFVEATGYRTDAEGGAGATKAASATGCLGWDGAENKFLVRPDAHWRSPGFEQGPAHPVTCMSWNDAQAYTAWLAARTGQPYRLPTEAEWELAARVGGSGSRPWGDDPEQACRHANVADASAPTLPERHPCSDGYSHTAPVGRFAANGAGLHDMIGNVWEWMADCYRKDIYTLAETEYAAAITAPNCTDHSLRGGSWFSGPARARTAYRGGYGAESRSNMYGFRVARTLP